MHRLRWLCERIDRLNAAIGRATSWGVLAMVALGAYNAVARYVGRSIGINLSSNAFIELQWYLFSLVFLLGAASVLQQDRHVRVDVLYARASPRTRAWIDLVGTVLFLIPFCGFAIWITWPSVASSWQILESSSDPGGLPRYPIKSVTLIAFALLALQGLSQLVQAVERLRGGDE
ncbi:MAG: TRAP transporter small permease subunit [Myxococcota bacterium]